MDAVKPEKAGVMEKAIAKVAMIPRPTASGANLRRVLGAVVGVDIIVAAFQAKFDYGSEHFLFQFG